MASKTPRRGNVSTSSARSTSPLSPTRTSRLQEKADLQNLNDRLAAYIDKVRHLELENSRLSRELHTTQETITRETTNIKSMYDSELNEARKLLDETSREKAKIEIDFKRIYEENEDLKSRLDKKTKEWSIADRNATHWEQRCGDVNNKYNQAIGERKKLQDEIKALQDELDKFRKLYEEAKKALESETLSRIDYENNLLSLREELSFKEQVHSQELNETRVRRQVELSEIDGRLTEKYEARLQESLQELRDQYEEQMRNNRDEIESLYHSKTQNLEAQVRRNAEANKRAEEDLHEAILRADSYTSRLTELENSNASYQARVRDLEKQLENERARASADRNMHLDEIKQLRDQMDNMMREYQDLMDIRVALDLEIAAYRKLLESEEARLNISPGQGSQEASSSTISSSQRVTRGTPLRGTPLRGGKRKRVMEESSDSSNFAVSSRASGEVTITEACPDGKFVKIHNKGTKDQSLGAWQLIRKAGDQETVYKFHRNVKIEPGATITIWASDSGQAHEPPSNLVMKGQKWFTADSMTTQLLNNDGEEMAASERTRQIVSSLRHREVHGYMSGHHSLGLREDFFHQQGDPVPQDERCLIM